MNPIKSHFKSFNKQKFINRLVITTLVGIIIGYLGTQTYQFYAKVMTTRSEIEFAMNHPALVAHLEQQYASKSAEVDQSLLQDHQSAQDQLLQQLSTDLKASK